MKPSPRHIIRQQVLEITGLKKADAEPTQERLSQLFHEQLIPILDQCFSRLSPGKEVHRIDKLELDLGKIPIGQLDQVWVEKMSEALDQQMHKILIQKKEYSIEKNTEANSQQKEISPELRHLKLLQYFLATGMLPWWADAKGDNPVKESVDFLITKAPSLLETNMKQWVKDRRSLKRLVRIFPFPQWLSLVSLQASLRLDELETLLSAVLAALRISSDELVSNRLSELVGIPFLVWVYSNRQVAMHSPDFWKGFLAQITKNQGAKYQAVFLQFVKNITAHKSANKEFSSTTSFQKLLQDLQQANPTIEIHQLVSKSGEPESDLPVKDTFSESEGLLVSNAGLVILWPYLIRFFDNLNLLDKRQFVDTAAKHRAVGLLQYLVDEQEEPMEFHCGFNKVLCGMEVQEVLEFGTLVTTTEKEACEQLLQAIIANAPILKNMSIDGFRGSFLARNGILKAGAESWRLQVEATSYDIVLERFPWQWNMVKLPWMPWGIGVEW